MHNDIFSSDKVHQLLSSHIQIHPHICLELAWKRCLICSYSSPDSDKTTFFSLEKAILLDPYFSLKAMVWSYKHINGGFVSNKHSAFHCNWWTGEVWTACGLLWCLDSFWRHPFTADDPLESKSWNAQFPPMYSDEETNSSTSCMAWEGGHFQQVFILGSLI